MGFVLFMLLIWAAAMLVWVVTTKYFKSSDLDRIKTRLAGSSKAKRIKASDQAGAIIQTEASPKHKLAQAVILKYRLGPKVEMLLEQAGLRWHPARFVHLCLVMFASGLILGYMLLPSNLWQLSILPGALAGAAPFVYVSFKRRGRLRRFEELFPDTLEFIGRSMRAGHAFAASLEMIYKEFQEPVSGEFRRTFEEHNLGLPLDVALQKLAKRVPSLDVHFFVSAVLLQKRTGGNLAEILDKLAYVIRERFKLRGRIRAVSAHGRMTAAALSSIPIAVAVLMFFTNPDYVKFFFTDDTGNIILGVAVFLQIVGYLIMKKIVNIEV